MNRDERKATARALLSAAKALEASVFSGMNMDGILEVDIEDAYDTIEDIKRIAKKHGGELDERAMSSRAGENAVHLLFDFPTGSDADQAGREIERLLKRSRVWHDNLDYGELKASVVSARLSESEFWRIIDQLGWGTRTTDYKKIKKTLMKKFSPEEAEEFQNMKGRLEGKLYKALDPVVRGVGSDSFGDLIAHIVGLGKEEYDAVMENPQLAQERVNQGDFEESFDYAVPFKSDYKYLMADEYIERGKRLVEENYPLDSESDKLNFWRKPVVEPDSPQGQRNVKIVRQALQKLARGDVDGFRRVERQVRKAAEELEKEIGSNKWAVWNIYSDMAEYMD